MHWNFGYPATENNLSRIVHGSVPLLQCYHLPPEQQNVLFAVTKPKDSLSWHSMPSTAFSCHFFTAISAACRGGRNFCTVHVHNLRYYTNIYSSTNPSLEPSTLLHPPPEVTQPADSQLPPDLILSSVCSKMSMYFPLLLIFHMLW